ncbi:hypothetical protein QM588_21980 [Rhodococcus sp. IEGM 1354]|jgi:hypothetical protein|uniref:hypothetical protein n=1 Tax=unclassified Rhodococcus (in: high G+C Gram-positive bacteria) TaxID=192944 RepID=UPI0024B84E78|nr:hypothetical protein [Rhodococcus sp. IEGM 1354]MDI9933097.1 hypothetical protein [Rhodococcus sp. IEGM 1354]
MEPLQPMRPVDVRYDEREAAPRWKVWGARIVLAALVLTAILVEDGQSWMVVAGVCASAIGAALIVASTRRTMRENTGRRIPWLGRPPVEPRRVDLLDTFGLPMVVFGIAVAAKSASVPWFFALPVVCVGAVGVPLAAQAWHNHRVRRSTPTP